MIENLEAMMEEADETKAGSSVKNEDIIGKDLTLEIDTSGLVWPFFCHVCPTLEMLRPSILLALQVPRHTHEPLDEAALANKSPQTLLLEHLRQSIAMRGPMSVDDYMREVLTHPKHGYYSATVKTLGEAGDFTTAPEVTPAFEGSTSLSRLDHGFFLAAGLTDVWGAYWGLVRRCLVAPWAAVDSACGVWPRPRLTHG